MIIRNNGACFLYEGVTYHIGDKIIATEESEYAGLNGVIFEIRDGEDKETDNETPDIYCSFEAPVLPSDIAELESTFSALYQEVKHLDDIALDSVIMAPEMILVQEQRKKIKVYALEEHWSADGNQGQTTYIRASLLEAKALLNSLLAEEIENGCISDWIGKSDYMTETTALSYEGWMEGQYMEFHYAVSVEELELSLSPALVGDIGRAYLENCRYEDFASQVAEWDEVGALTDRNYQQYLTDARIPDMIDKHLGDGYWESYWEAVSEVAHTLLREYLDKNTHLGQNTQNKF